MKRDYCFLSPKNAEEVEFTWDINTGELTGRDADMLITYIKYSRTEGSVTIHPWPTYCPIKKDPLFNMPEMAAVIYSMGFNLTEEFMAALDTIRPGEDCEEAAWGIDAEGKIHSIQSIN